MNNLKKLSNSFLVSSSAILIAGIVAGIIHKYSGEENISISYFFFVLFLSYLQNVVYLTIILFIAKIILQMLSKTNPLLKYFLYYLTILILYPLSRDLLDLNRVSNTYTNAIKILLIVIVIIIDILINFLKLKRPNETKN
jgi:uncharacterized membrane protein